MGDPPNRRNRAPFTARDVGLLVPFALAALFAARGRTSAAIVVGVLGAAVVIARVAFGDLVPRATARIAQAVERALTAVVVAIAWGLVVAPAWTFRRLRRADRPPKSVPATWWAPSAPRTADTRTFGSPTASSGHRRSRLLGAIGVIVVLMVVDIVAGVAWQNFTRSAVTAPAAEALGIARDGTHRDVRASSPALVEYPWAEDQLREMQRLPQGYWPYTLSRPLPFESETVTIDGWSRRSYEPAWSDADLPVVAFFGGSTTFGEGQRDEHTIPSEIARLAEQAGTPIRVINYGQRSWTAWQEAILFEQLTAMPEGPDTPDLVVFYDGANEVIQQEQDSTAGFPTHFNVDGVAETLTGRDAGGAAGSDSLVQDMADWYSSRSVALRGLRGIQSAIGLGDDPAQPYVSTSPREVVGERAADVYVRARDFVASTAERQGIDSVFYWQPVPEWQDDIGFRTASEQVGDETIVISDALDDHPDTYFDNVHTNEVGAQVVAARMWETLQDRVADVD